MGEVDSEVLTIDVELELELTSEQRDVAIVAQDSNHHAVGCGIFDDDELEELNVEMLDGEGAGGVVGVVVIANDVEESRDIGWLRP